MKLSLSFSASSGEFPSNTYSRESLSVFSPSRLKNHDDVDYEGDTDSGITEIRIESQLSGQCKSYYEEDEVHYKRNFDMKELITCPNLEWNLQNPLAL